MNALNGVCRLNLSPMGRLSRYVNRGKRQLNDQTLVYKTIEESSDIVTCLFPLEPRCGDAKVIKFIGFKPAMRPSKHSTCSLLFPTEHLVLLLHS